MNAYTDVHFLLLSCLNLSYENINKYINSSSEKFMMKFKFWITKNCISFSKMCFKTTNVLEFVKCIM